MQLASLKGMEHHNDLIAKARALEQEEKPEEAAAFYEKVVKEDALNENAIGRLLIIYRKLKEYRKEMQLLNASIKAGTTKVQDKQAAWSKKHPKAAKASKYLLYILSTAKTKAFTNYEEPAVQSWRKRKEGLAKKMK